MSSIPNATSSARQKIFMFLLSAFTALGFGVGSGAVYMVTYIPTDRKQTVQLSQQKVTLDHYQRLEIGDSLKDVELILGSGVEESRIGDQFTFVWENADGSYIKASFDADELVSKQQFDLLRYPVCHSDMV